jgi:2-polyprenyl-3-methyl-5-hydroxy-6-metoxy-1,4-benzoquinol methylase
MNTPRWFTETKPGHSQWYAEHFRALASDGADLAGEARFLDALTAPGSTILDAGCGQGRTAGALARRGHHVTAVDVDPILIDAARIDNPGPTYICTDLTDTTATDHIRKSAAAEYFDAAISAGNVITYVAPEAEVDFLRTIATLLSPGAPYALGFHTARYELTDFDRHATTAGFSIEQRFATWDLRPWTSHADFAVTVLRTSNAQAG